MFACWLMGFSFGLLAAGIPLGMLYYGEYKSRVFWFASYIEASNAQVLERTCKPERTEP